MRCRVHGCGGMHYAKGYCLKHWERVRRHGDPLGGWAGQRERDQWREVFIGLGVKRYPKDPDG